MLLSCCGIGRLQSPERVKNYLRDDQAGVVLIVCGDNIPRSVKGAGCAEALFVSLRVFLPELSLVNVRKDQLPVLFGIIDAYQKPLPLPIFRYMQEPLDDARAVSVKVLLEVHNGTISIVPFRFIIL